MNRYDQLVWSAVSSLVDYALRFGIEPDEIKVATIIAKTMFPYLESGELTKRIAEIREVAQSYIEAARAIENAAVLA